MSPDAQWIEAVLWSALWQSSAWLLVGLVAGALLRGRPARAHAVMLLCILGAALTPVLGAAFRLGGLGLLPGLNRSVDVAELAARLSGDDGAAAIPAVITAAHLLAAAWLAVSVVAILRLARSARRGRHLLAQATRLESGRLHGEALRAAERMGLAGLPQLYRSTAVRCPVIWCWGSRPTVILPVRDVDPDGLFGVLCHELAHYKRRDHIWTLVGELALCVLPWNPLAWVAVRRMRDLCEQACDAWAITAGQSPTTYAETLLDMVPHQAIALAPSAVGGRRAVARRIHRILGPRPDDPTSGLRWVTIMGIATTLVLAGVSLGHRRPPTIEVVADNGATAPLVGPDVIAIPGELDLGIAGPGESRTHEIVLCNRSTTPRAVFGASASCGCTTVSEFVPQTLDPGECLKLDITMTAPAEPGTRKTKHVTFDIEGQPPLELAVHLLAADRQP